MERAPGGQRNTDNDEGAGRSRDGRDRSNTCAKWRIGQVGEYQNNMGRDLSEDDRFRFQYPCAPVITLGADWIFRIFGKQY